MKRNYLFVLALAAALSACHKSTPTTHENQLLFATESTEPEEDEIRIVSSPDGTICIYTRNNYSHDASWGWSVIYDVKDKDSVYTYEGLPDWQGEASSIAKIHSLPHSKRHLYLFDAFFRISGAYGYQAFITYERIGHTLQRVPLICDDEGQLTNEIGFEYNFGDYYFRFARALTYDYQYLWDEPNGILYYPVLKQDSYLLIDKFVKFRWNGKTLSPTTDTVCNPRLYEPLRNYVSCFQHTAAERVQVRVDSLPDGRWRYAAWDRERAVNTEPDIVLYGERKDTVFHFYNPPTYTYVVTIEDIPEILIYHGDSVGQLTELSNRYKEE